MYLATVYTTVFHNAWIRIGLIIVAVLIVQNFTYSVITRLVRRVVRVNHYEDKTDERKREDTLIHIFNDAATVALWVIAVLVILSELNVNIAALATGAGLIGVLVGFGAQNAIRDYLAGIFIIMENQYRVGDIIMVSAGSTGAGVGGVVEEITMRTTRLRDQDGYLHIVRNSDPGIVTNMSIKFANVNVNVGVAYDTDIDKVEKIINEAGLTQAGEDKWKKDIIEPVHFLRIDDFDDSSVVLKCLGKVKPARQWDISADFRRRLKAEFEKNDIGWPLPQQIIHQPKVKGVKA